VNRCTWAKGELLAAYHDAEWGVPVRDERKLFEFLVLDGFQAGLSWEIVLRKRSGFTEAFAGFDPEKVAGFGPEDESRLLQNPGIIRNKLKVKAAITNARAVLELRRGGGLADFMWAFVDGRTIQNSWEADEQIPAQTRESEKMSKELKKLGFKFVGPTIVYAVMQSAGLVNDHLTSCFRYREILEMSD